MAKARSFLRDDAPLQRMIGMARRIFAEKAQQPGRGLRNYPQLCLFAVESISALATT
jgi:hypothetical protein